MLNEWVELYGEDSDFVKIRVRGIFPSASDTQFISASIADEAQKRVYKVGQFNNLPTIIGLAHHRTPQGKVVDNLEYLST